jgi:AAA family ATP:ADP antiporter
VLSRLLGIHAEDRRDATAAFLTLFGVMTAHAVLETARDALFLSKLPARDLPLAYIAIAGLSLGVVAVGRKLAGVSARRSALSATLVVGAAITASFHVLARSESTSALLALYVWTGLLASIVVVDLWLLAGQVLNFGQAKRVFSFIGAGGLAGAVVGSALAGALLLRLAPRDLLLVAASILGVTAIAPLFFSPARVSPLPRKTGSSSSWLGVVRSEPYLFRLLWVSLTCSMLVTGVDFVFKATASVDLAPDQLGPFFARFYATIGVVALLVQLFVAPWLLRVLGVNGSLLLLPALLLAGSAGFVLSGGLGAAMIARGADGALRHSLHRTGTEILYVPLAQPVRERFKSFVEAAGQRGGQGLASVLLLVAMRGGLKPTEIGVGLLAVAVLWLGGTVGLRPHYVDLFRRNLREGALETHLEVPDLDLHSFEALIAALSSHNDAEVLASLDLLASYGKTNLVPALILYHPSESVVLRAFDLFAKSERPDVERLVRRLMDHDDERIRASALRYSAGRADATLLESMSGDPSPLVRTTTVVELIRRGTVDEWKGGDILRGIIDGGTPEDRRALAFAAHELPHGRYSWALVRLAFVNEPGLAAEVARSMATAPDLEFVPTLVRLLAHRESREAARDAILSLGDSALTALDAALSDASLPRTVRLHLPRTIAKFGTQEAAKILERRLLVEPDEAVLLKHLRSLGRMRAKTPELDVDRRLLLELAKSTLERAVTLLFQRVVVERTLAAGEPKTPVAEMLVALLSDKENITLDRVFRVLTIIDPSEEFGILFAGLRSDDARRRDSGRELLSHVVSEPLRSGILAMLSDGSAEARLRDAARFHSPVGRVRFERATAAPTRAEAENELAAVHVECLRSMLLDSSDALRAVSSYRIAELGLDELSSELRSAATQEKGALAELADRAVDLLDQQQEEVSRAG